jgi:hypothetical protein
MSAVVSKYRENLVVSFYRAEETYYKTLERIVDNVSWLK